MAGTPLFASSLLLARVCIGRDLEELDLGMKSKYSGMGRGCLVKFIYLTFFERQEESAFICWFKK